MANSSRKTFFFDSGMLCCRLCEHSIDQRVDTAKRYLKSKKHSTRKCSKQKLGETESSSLPSTSRQDTLSSIVKSNNMKEEFAFDYIMFCTLADIPLFETEKMWPFLQKYCRHWQSASCINSTQGVCTSSF